MRAITILGAAIAFLVIVAAGWATTLGNQDPAGRAASGSLNPIEMMKNAKDLPATHVADFI